MHVGRENVIKVISDTEAAALCEAWGVDAETYRKYFKLKNA